LLTILSQNPIFGLLDWIAPKLLRKSEEKKIKDQDSFRRDFLRDSAPQNPKSHCLDPFFIFFIFHILKKIRKKIASILFDF